MIEQKIGYTFKNKNILIRALTHSSFANETHKHDTSNERLEFLGDSVLSLVTSDYLYTHCTDCEEGELTKLRSAVVCEKSLYKFAISISLGDDLLLGKGERHTGGDKRPSLLADAFEAIIAAIYLDGGIDEARKFILSYIVPAVDEVLKGSATDYKTCLQEIIQQNREELLEYKLVLESGPDHNKIFEVEVLLNSNIIGKGIGKSKKDAEQLAACQALELMGHKF